MPKPPDLSALYAAILDDPDDVARRLGYADALQEAGDPRGELIARMAADPERRLPTHHLRSTDYGDDEELIALYKKQAKRWVDPLKPYLGLENAEWWCGVIDEMKVDTAKLAKGAATVFAAMPIRTLSLVGRKAALAQLAAVDEMRCVRTLSLSTFERQPPVSAKQLAALAGPAFAGVRTLSLYKNDLDDAALEVVLGAGGAPLRALTLSHNRVTVAGARLLATAPRAAALEELTLDFNPIGDEGGAAIAAALGGLRRLALWGCGVGDDTVRAIAANRRLGGLEHLDLTGARLSAPAFRALLDSPAGRSLRALRMQRSDVPAAHRAEWRTRFPDSESF